MRLYRIVTREVTTYEYIIESGDALKDITYEHIEGLTGEEIRHECDIISVEIIPEEE